MELLVRSQMKWICVWQELGSIQKGLIQSVSKSDRKYSSSTCKVLLPGTSLVVQRLRLHTCNSGARVQSLVGEVLPATDQFLRHCTGMLRSSPQPISLTLTTYTPTVQTLVLGEQQGSELAPSFPAPSPDSAGALETARCHWRELRPVPRGSFWLGRTQPGSRCLPLNS